MRQAWQVVNYAKPLQLRCSGTQAGSLCYINAVASSLQVHGEPPKMALTEPRLYHSATPSLLPNLSRFHTLNEVFGLAASLLVG
jgi:hypothetical protein